MWESSYFVLLSEDQDDFVLRHYNPKMITLDKETKKNLEFLRNISRMTAETPLVLEVLSAPMQET